MFRHVSKIPAIAAAMSCALALPLQAQAAWDSTVSAAFTADSLTSTTALPSNTPLHIAVSLKMQNRAALDAFIKNVYTPGNPQYGRYLTPTQFAAQYAPSAAQAQTVVDYLNGLGMHNVTLAGNRMLITASTTAGVAQKAFNTQLVQYSSSGRTVRAYTKALQVPDTLGGVVLAVLGLDNRVQMKTVLQQSRDKAAAQTVYPPLTAQASAALAHALKLNSVTAASSDNAVATAYPPTAWAIAYDAGTSPDGTNSTIAISTYGGTDASVVDDLRQMERQYGLPYVPVEVRIPPDGIAAPDDSGDDEWDLDSQSSTAIAHNVKKLILYTGDGSTDQLLWQYNQFATLADAQAGNMSYGTCELDAITGLLLPEPAAADQAFAQAVAEGLSWHASTGDDGGVCSPINALGAPLAGVPLIANYPDSSPYVVAVGGTSLITDAQFNYSSEIAWTSGGGGISVIEGAPTWQAGIVPSALLSAIPGVLTPVTGGTGVGRGVPDIALNAGIYLPEAAIAAAADTIVGGTHYAVVGTSLSSPLAVGVWARMQSAHCNALGFAAPAYYALDTAGGLLSTATGFHDVTIGTNGDYVATPGWDYTTGFGSPDLALVNAALPAAASSCDASPTPPAASLTASATTGAGTLSVDFSGASSSDPHGGGLNYYTIDFGDDTLPLQQTTANFASHVYASPGVYTASLTVVNSQGAVSTPSTQKITVTGTPTACAIPGKTLVTSDAGTAGVALPVPIVGALIPAIPDPLSGQDLLSASVAEPAAQAGKLVFTIKTGSLSPLPPLTRWAVFFTIPGDTTAYYVAMNTDSGAATFTYGQRGTVDGIKVSVAGLLTVYNQLGTLDATSNYTDDGTITLVLDKTTLGLQTGQTLNALLASVAVAIDLLPTAVGGGTAVAAGETVDSAGTRFGYTLVGNDVCATGIVAPTGTGSSGGSGSSGSGGSTSGGGGGASAGAFGFGALLPLLMAGLVRRRRGIPRA
jgi:subtilase family serine protease